MGKAEKNNGVLTFNDQEKLESYVNLIVEEHKKALYEDNESMLDNIDDKISKMDITFSQLVKLTPIYTMIYFNHNESMCQYFPREKSTRTKLFNHLKKVQLNDVFEKEEMMIFLMWTGSLWIDDEYSVLIDRFCKSITVENKSLLIKLRNLVRDFVHYDKSMEIINKTSNKLKIRYADEEIAKKTIKKEILDELFEEDINKI